MQTPRKLPLPTCQSFGVTFMDTTIIYKIESFDMTDSNLESYLEIDCEDQVRAFRKLSDGTVDEVHGITFSHKKHQSTAGTLNDMKKFIKYLHRIL